MPHMFSDNYVLWITKNTTDTHVLQNWRKDIRKSNKKNFSQRETKSYYKKHQFTKYVYLTVGLNYITKGCKYYVEQFLQSAKV